MKLYPVSREFILFNLEVLLDENGPYSDNPNYDLYDEVHNLLNLIHKYKGRLPGKEYARAKELAVGREIARDKKCREVCADIKNAVKYFNSL